MQNAGTRPVSVHLLPSLSQPSPPPSHSPHPPPGVAIIYADASGRPLVSVPASTVPTDNGGSGQLLTAVSTQIQEAHSTTTVTTNVISLADPETSRSEKEIEHDKDVIYRHPLFPLLALLFEKCEQATQTPDCPSSDDFDIDIQAFVMHQEHDSKPFFSDDTELDGLMVKSIQVLRIHLLELEKVSELCKDFCSRYITCLKGKLQSESLLSIDNADADVEDMDLGPDPEGLQAVGAAGLMLQTVGMGGAMGPGTQGLAQGQVMSGGTVYQMVQTPQGVVAQPIQIQTPVAVPTSPATPVIQGSTPMSHIGMPTPAACAQTIVPKTPTLPVSPECLDEEEHTRKKSKRGVLPTQSTKVMKSWLYQHIVHPYPTEDEKRQIAAQTNLSLLQVNNWFINARRRILQPMLDASNPLASAVSTKAKKPKPQGRLVQRFWPDSIANMQPTAVMTGQSPATAMDGVVCETDDGLEIQPGTILSTPLIVPLCDGVASPPSSQPSPVPPPPEVLALMSTTLPGMPLAPTAVHIVENGSESPPRRRGVDEDSDSSD